MRRIKNVCAMMSDWSTGRIAVIETNCEESPDPAVATFVVILSGRANHSYRAVLYRFDDCARKQGGSTYC